MPEAVGSFLAVAVVILSCVVVYLSVNDKVEKVTPGPFTERSDGTFVVKEGTIVCEGTCPSLADRVPGVNFYLKSGGLVFGNYSLRIRKDGSAFLSYHSNVLVNLLNGGAVIGNVVSTQPENGTIQIVGMAPNSQLPNDYATVESEISLKTQGQGSAKFAFVTEKAGSASRQGFRISFREYLFTYFVEPTPQVVIGLPPIQYILNNRGATFITEDAAQTLAAYPCVEGPFSETYDRLIVSINAAPSTCHNSIEGRMTRVVVQLKELLNCVPIYDFQPLLAQLLPVDPFDYICFSSNVCSTAQNTLTVRQRQGLNGLLANSTTTIPLGCSPVGSTQFYLRCDRASF